MKPKVFIPVLVLLALPFLYVNCAGGLKTQGLDGTSTSGSSIGLGGPTPTSGPLPTTCTQPNCLNSAGTPIGYSTPNSIGVEWKYQWDANHNGGVSIQYRPSGSSVNWKTGMPLVRIEDARNTKFAGSLFFLDPGTSYDIQLQMSDPDGGGETQKLTVTTRSWPVLPKNGRTLYVAPTGIAGGTGADEAHPIVGVAAALDIAKPGDIFLLAPGTYQGAGGLPTDFSKSGTPGNYIVWKNSGKGEVLLKGDKRGIILSGSWVWFDGITFRNNDYGIVARASTDVVLTHNQFLGNHYGMISQMGAGPRWFILDNVFVGDQDPVLNKDSLDGEAIELFFADDVVVAYNSITHVADGYSDPGRNTDIFGNDIFDVTDDLIETDGGGSNVRVWGNRLHNGGHNVFSFQPQRDGPWYYIRNQVAGFSEGLLKLRLWTEDGQSYIPAGFVLLNNTILSSQFIIADIAPVSNYLLNGIVKNNLFVITGPAPKNWGSVYPLRSPVKSWRTELDYNGYYVPPGDLAFAWANPDGTNLQKFTALAPWAAVSGLEPHGLEIGSPADCFASYNFPGPVPQSIPAQYFTLRSTCKAVDSGVFVPNINDGFSGTAPDLGAYELGQATPHYGPR